MPFFSPLRYPGGKGRLGEWMAELMRYNKLNGGWYAEPYAGGAGIALHLLLKGYVKEIYINDLNLGIYALWKTILEDCDELINLIQKKPITIDERKNQFKKIMNPNSYTTTELGFATLYLNRTSKSGIITGGPIGGHAQRGRWKVDARFNKRNIIKRIELINKYNKNIILHNKDALEFLNNELPNNTNGLIYLDPPYFASGKDLYQNDYNRNDHYDISKFIYKLNYPWILTYDDTPEIENIYNWVKGGRFNIYYTVNNKKRRNSTELIFYNYLNLKPQPYSKR